MVWQEHGVYELEALMCVPDDGLTLDVDRVSQDPLDAAEHVMDDEVGLEVLLVSNFSTGYPLKDILPCHLSSVDRLVRLRAWVKMEPLP
jgi:hypothetical protein